MQVDPKHIHPRSKRLFPPSPPRPLHEPLKAVPAGTSKARPAWNYRGARRNLARYPSRAMQLKRERLAIGFTRREYDKWRATA
jgi:hypothetical protein